MSELELNEEGDRNFGVAGSLASAMVSLTVVSAILLVELGGEEVGCGRIACAAVGGGRVG